MKLYRLFTISLALAISTPVMASEVFEGSFRTLPQFGGGKEKEYRLVIELISVDGGKVQAKIASPDSMKCTREDEAAGRISGNEISIRGKSEPELKGCGRLNFRGVRDGDLLVGTTFFEGKNQDIKLRKR